MDIWTSLLFLDFVCAGVEEDHAYSPLPGSTWMPWGIPSVVTRYLQGCAIKVRPDFMEGTLSMVNAQLPVHLSAQIPICECPMQYRASLVWSFNSFFLTTYKSLAI